MKESNVPVVAELNSKQDLSGFGVLHHKVLELGRGSEVRASRWVKGNI